MKQLSNWGIALLALFAPIKPAIIAVFVLVVADLITGLLAAKKRKEKITSSGIKRTVGKLLLYESAILLAFIAETYLTAHLLPVCKLVTAVIGLTELKSVLENLDTLSGGSLYKSLIDKITNSSKLS